jgi:uncharacterized damage-inducible protein DinB
MTIDTAPVAEPTTERGDLLEALAAARRFLRHTVAGLSDGQATTRTTPSALHLAGIVKHVARMEERWARFVVEGPDAIGAADESSYAAHAESFELLAGESLAGVLAHYESVAARTDELVRSLPDLDASHPLPPAPWFEPGARRTARRTLLHIVGETHHHAGHADIIREALDGQKTMG